MICAVRQRIYDAQMAVVVKGRMPVDKHMPRVSGALRWTNMLRQRLTASLKSFTALDHP